MGHTKPVATAVFSPDGKKLLTGSWDGTAKLWDAETGIRLADLKGHFSSINSVDFSPSGKKIVTASSDGTAKIWDAETGKLLLDLTGHSFSVDDAQFSPDGNKIVTASWDGSARIWDVATGKLLAELKDHAKGVNSARFSPDGKKIVTAAGSWKSSGDSTAKIWDATTGTLLHDLIGFTTKVNSAEFSPNGTEILTSSGTHTPGSDNSAQVWDARTGKLLRTLKGFTSSVDDAKFSPDGKIIATNSGDSSIKIWDAYTLKLVFELKHNHRINSMEFSPDGKKIITGSRVNTVKIWDLLDGKIMTELSGHQLLIMSARFSPDGKKIISASQDNTARIWDAATGKLLFELTGHSQPHGKIEFSRDGKKIITNNTKLWDAVSGSLLKNLNRYHGDSVLALSTDIKKILSISGDSAISIWDIGSDSLLARLIDSHHFVFSNFSQDGKKIVTSTKDSVVKIWDASTGNLLSILPKQPAEIYTAQFSPDGKRIATGSYNKPTKIWDVETGRFLMELKGESPPVFLIQFSPNGKKIVTSTGLRRPNQLYRPNLKIWDVETGNILLDIKGHTSFVWSAQFSPDGKKLITASADFTAKIWDADSGKVLLDMKVQSTEYYAVQFYPDGKRIITASGDNTTRVGDALTGEVLYSQIAIDSTDYLIIDKYNRYDGSERARNLLYFTCGTEVIELDQVKDQLWVPGLAERIMKGDSINAKTLDQLDICGLTPVVGEMEGNTDSYHFRIQPRRGGLGETVVFINGIEVKRYKKEQLLKKGGSYELHIKKQELNNYFIAGRVNPVTVKVWVTDNTLSSRGLIVREDRTREVMVAPNLYAVLVGVSDYKGDELDLKYAAKDATDISNALSAASQKFLNTDGKQHVFTYNLTTNNERYLLPEKNSIKKTLEEIGKKATANDILMIFFAGHGIMAGKDKKQFYFLTADASKASATDAIAEVGISTEELTEWMKPSNIKAQKRILIFDACNSGQAIRDFVQLGKSGQGYVAARNDERAQQIKAIEKLNNQSGLIILAASASNQNAYEMGRYSQGLLTYSLLKVMKQQPEILENGKYLDVANWLNASKKMVIKLAESTGARQEPQLNSNNNFNIGVIDDEVRRSILLSSEKPIFSRSNFQNADTKVDNLKLGTAINKELITISSQGNHGDITYSSDYEGEDAYALSGDYKISGDLISVYLLLTKGGPEIVNRFQLNGTVTELSKLIDSITRVTIEWVKKQ